MIISTITIHCRAEKRLEIVQTIKDLTAQLTKDGGCIRSDLYQDLDNPDTLYFTEEWQTTKDLDKYKTSKSLAVLLGLKTLLAESVEIRHAVKL